MNTAHIQAQKLLFLFMNQIFNFLNEHLYCQLAYGTESKKFYVTALFRDSLACVTNQFDDFGKAERFYDLTILPDRLERVDFYGKKQK